MEKKYIERTLPYEISNLKSYMIMDVKNATCKYLWGPDGVGKTTLVNSWLEEWNLDRQKASKVYFFYVDLKDIDNTGRMGYWEIWKKLCNAFEQTIPNENYGNKKKEVLDAYGQMRFSVEEIAGNYAENARYTIDNLFHIFTDLGIQLKVVLDNFEEVVRIFPQDTDDGLFFERLYGLSPKGTLKNLNLSILIISDRCIDETVHHMEGGSTFESAYNPIYISGFDKKDINSYYTMLEDSVGVLTGEQKNRIHYYCGTHPKMLMIMQQMLTENGKQAEYDIDRLYEEFGDTLKLYYESFCEKLEAMDLTEFWADILTEGDSQEKKWSSETLYECGFLYRELYDDECIPLSQGLFEYISEKIN